jgi:carbohydrate diacid regulator
MFCAQVSATDSLGRIIASSVPNHYEGAAVVPAGHDDEWLRVPFSVSGHSGDLLVGPTANGEVLSQRLVESVVELLVGQITVIESLPDQHELKNRFIWRLLHSDIPDEADALREGQILGMDLLRPRAVMLIDASEYVMGREGHNTAAGSDDWLRARNVIKRIVHFFSLPSDAICAYIGEGEIAVLKASSSRDLGHWAIGAANDDLPPSWSNLTALKRAGEELLSALKRDTGTDVSMGIGRYHRGIRDLSRSYEDARTALVVGKRFAEPGRLYCLDELGMAALVGISDEQTRRELASHLLGPLENESELMQTLDAFFAENCSSVGTAAKLFIHRNTLNYRLDKIASLTGLDPKRFDCAMVIRFALLLCEFVRPQPLCNRPFDAPVEPQHLYNRPMQPLMMPA